MHIIAVANQKGGVGKTTVSVNLAAGLALFEIDNNPEKLERVLLVDMDSQCHSVRIVSGGLFSPNGRHPIPRDRQLAELLTADQPYPTYESILASQLPAAVNEPNLDYLPANSRDMAKAQRQLVYTELFQYRLSDALEGLDDLYKYVIIDTPPGPNTLLTNALFAANYVVIPVQTTGLGFAGFRETLNSISLARQPRANPELEILGVLPTMLTQTSESRMFHEAILEECSLPEFKEEFGDVMVFDPIYYRTEVSVACTDGLDIFSYHPSAQDLLSQESTSRAVNEFTGLILTVSDYFSKV